MNKVKFSAVLFSFAIVLMGCPKNNKEALGDVPPTQDSVATGAQVDSGANASDREALAAQQLENERKQLEDMINQIMSQDVYFEYDKAVLTEKARELLSQVGDKLMKEARFDIMVEGHTDERGTESYNLSLGGKRAQAVYKYLTDYGVSTDRLHTMSFGEEKPKVEGQSEDAYAQNRRAAFKVKIRN